jgi:hypothetical protein
MNKSFVLPILFVLTTGLQAKAFIGEYFCQKAISAYRVLTEGLESPLPRVTEDGDVVATVFDDFTKSHRTIRLAGLVDKRTLTLTRANLWLVRHWKFLLLPEMIWLPAFGQKYTMVGIGQFANGDIAIELPKNGKIKVSITQGNPSAAAYTRKAIRDGELYVQREFNSRFEVVTVQDSDTNFIELDTSAGYELNNAFIQQVALALYSRFL